MSVTAVEEVIATLKAHGSRKNVEGMGRFGITSRKALGVSAPDLRTIALGIGKSHTLAAALWRTGILEARILAAFIEEPEKVTATQMDRWAKDFDSWAVCDGVCLHLFVKTPFAREKALRWCNDKREFVRRAGFAMMACLAVHDKKATDRQFQKFLPAIRRAATDERNFVRKAVNWALRQIGKRNSFLNRKAIRLAKEIQKTNSKSARWIAADALRELTGNAVQRKLAK